jgi:hypothetical protein
VRGNEKQQLVVLLDEGAPHSSAEPFLQNGYKAIYHGDVLDSGASDELVAVTAILNEAILIAVDRDMRRIVRRFGAARDGGRFERLNLIWVACDPVMATRRLSHAMSFIEHEWAIACELVARRMWVNIENHKLTTYR